MNDCSDLESICEYKSFDVCVYVKNKCWKLLHLHNENSKINTRLFHIHGNPAIVIKSKSCAIPKQKQAKAWQLTLVICSVKVTHLVRLCVSHCCLWPKQNRTKQKLKETKKHILKVNKIHDLSQSGGALVITLVENVALALNSVKESEIKFN